MLGAWFCITAKLCSSGTKHKIMSFLSRLREYNEEEKDANIRESDKL